MQLLRSLAHRNFRLFFAGQAMSMVGTWMQATAIGWLTWQLTHSSTWLGAMGFATQIPTLFVGVLGGVLADRVQRYRLVITIQILAMIQAVALAILTLSGNIDAPMVFVLALLCGVIFAFDYPARQSFVMDMVGKEDIPNAIALNSSIVHGARVLGPAIAGIIVAKWGEGTCFAINAVSFIFVLAALFMIRKGELYPQVIEEQGSVSASISSAFKVFWSMEKIKGPLILMATLSLAAMPYIVLLPQVVSEDFGGGAYKLGLAMSSAGLGALIGAGFLALKKRMDDLDKVVTYNLLLNALGLITFSVARDFVVAIPSLVIIGLSGFLVVAGTQTILQIASPGQLRGRILSLFTIFFFGLTPIGSLVAGFLASFIGAKPTIMIGGVICAAVAFIFLIRRKTKTIDL